MKFSKGWFQMHIPTWNSIVPQYAPRRVLEVGSYEGQSICYVIQLMRDRHPMEIYCLDTWEGGGEHKAEGVDMSEVETAFDANVGEAIANAPLGVKLIKMKGRSDIGLPALIAEGKLGYFDMIYIDGSHETPDVLADAIMAFRLLRVGGLMIFDDYLWSSGVEAGPLDNPKMGIDSFLNCYQRKIQQHMQLPNYQLYCRKLRD